jgi:hypothetical protein
MTSEGLNRMLNNRSLSCIGTRAENPFEWRLKNIVMTGLLLVSLAVGVPGLAYAHMEKPLHGGQVADVNDLSLELLVKDKRVMVYVRDHGKPLSVAGASGRLVRVGADGRSDTALHPTADASALTGEFSEDVQKGSKLVISVSMPGRKPLQTRFVLR